MALSLISDGFLPALREKLIVYSFSIFGLLAGLIVASQLGIFQMSPWAIAIYPAILSAKGVTSGLLSGRLSTALHLGTVKPKFFNNTKAFRTLIEALVLITLLTSIVMSCFSLIFGIAFWGITLGAFSEILLVVMATMSLGLLLSFVTIKVAFLSFEKNLDPDVVVYPLMSTVSDIFVTICYILVLNIFFFSNTMGTHVLLLIGIAAVFLALYILAKNFRDQVFLKTVKESLITMVVVAFIVSVTGTILKSISSIVISRKEIYTIYPAVISVVGSVGSVVGSTATTKLSLGLLSPSLSSIKNHSKTIFTSWVASLAVFIVLCVGSLLINGVLLPMTFLSLSSVLILTNLIAVSIIVLLSYVIAILTFMKGLDPDNFVIPIESSFADSITSIALLVALLIFG